MSIKITIPNTSSDVLTFGSANTPTAAQIAGIDSGSSNGQLALYTTASGTSTEAVRITAAQNVGIGVTTVGAKLHVLGSSQSAIFASTSATLNYTEYRYNTTTSNGYIGNGGILTPTGAATDFVVRSEGALAFATGGATERARIDTSGNLLMGTTSANAKLTVQQSTSNAVTGAFASTATTNSFVMDLQTYAVAANATLLRGFSNTSTQVLNIAGNGNITNTNNSYGAISDVKLKEKIVDATPKLANLMQVKVCNYNMIGDTTKQIGVIAQELEQVFPSMVDESPDRDAEGNDLGTTTKSVKYSVFVPILIKAIQEQQALITQLQADVAALKGASA